MKLLENHEVLGLTLMDRVTHKFYLVYTQMSNIIRWAFVCWVSKEIISYKLCNL